MPIDEALLPDRERTTLSIEDGLPLALDPMLQGKPLTLGQFICEVVAARPDHEAIVTETERVSYADLGKRSRAIARALVAHGVGAGTRVGLLLPNGPEWVAAFFAATSIGAVVVALNTLAIDTDLEAMLLHSDTQVLLTSGDTAARVASAPAALRHAVLVPGERAGRDAGLPALARTVRLDDSAFIATADDVSDELVDALVERVVPDDDAMILFTSGSTGTPKAVLHGHRAICIQSWRWQHFEDRRSTDRIWSTSPFFWTSGLVRTLGSSLAAGATLVIQARFEPGAALAMLEKERVTAVLSRHHLDHRLLEHPDFNTRDLSSIRRIYRNSPLADRLGALPFTPAGYGMTETMTLVSQSPTGAVDEPDNGQILPGTTIRIVDVDSSVVTPRNVAGRICVRGATLMRGYCKRPHDETFDADGYFPTADLGFLDDEGRLHFTGRLDDMIKVAGAAVYPAVVERHVAEMGGLLAFSVFALPHPTLGAALVLCAAPAPAVQASEPARDERTIDEYLRTRLASYQAPRRILLIDGDRLTFTSSQKVDLTAMRRLGLEQMLEDDSDPAWAQHLQNARDAGELSGFEA
jgi:fatty-acyl-CoA synthase